LSVDIARELGTHRKEIIEGNLFADADDVTVGHWIATRVSRVPVSTFIEDVKRQGAMTPDHIFVACPEGTVDYVMAPAHRHRPVPNAFHYHFHSRTGHDMMEFHERYH